MNVGITGHQQRDGIEWPWVARTMRSELSKIRGIERAYSSLAVGTDQVFAEVALNLGLEVVAVLPLEGYERYFQDDGLAEYRRLLAQCRPIRLNWKGAPERAFFEAGKFIVDNCSLLLAVWDGAPAKGQGGTADVVGYARKRGCPVTNLNPTNQTIETLSSH